MKVDYEFGKGVDTGQVRRGKPNQDFIAVALPGWFSRLPPLLVLSDGMGGYGGGEIASRLAVQAVVRAYRHSRPKEQGWLEVLRSAVDSAHQAVTRKAKRVERLQAMGCTIVIAVLTPTEVHIANVGDSRAYLINAGEVRQLSYDHSVVAEQVRLGLISAEEARHHPKRNVLSLSLSARRERVDPYLVSIPWRAGETLLLCSDGLWGVVSEAQMQMAVLQLPPQKAADKLIQMANINRGPDNISVIIAQRRGESVPQCRDEDTAPGIILPPAAGQ